MYFFLAFFTIATAGAVISARTLCGYNQISIFWKISIFLILWGSWLAPLILGIIRRKGWIEGWFFDVLSFAGYFMFGFAFILFMLLIFRDIVWSSAFHLSKFWHTPSQSWNPMNVVALTKANFIVFGLAVLVSFYSLYHGIKTPQIREVVIETSKVDHEIKLLQINDMHIDRSKPVSWFANMVKVANAENADVVLLPGDIIDDKVDYIMPQIEPLKGLKSRYGIYFAPGNHEFYNGLTGIQWQLGKLGWTWLSGSGRTIDELPLYIAGIPDIPSRREVSSYENLLNDSKSDDYKILLAHNPSHAQEFIKLGFDLQLSAHTHGGQIFPFHIPTKYVNHYLAGLYELDGGKLHISRGAGYWGPPFRLLAPSDMTLIRLKPIK